MRRSPPRPDEVHVERFFHLAHEQIALSERELDRVRAILADAADRLLRDIEERSRRLGQAPSQHALTGLQFQDICDQMLVHARNRLSRVRAGMRGLAEGSTCPAIEKHPASPVEAAHLAPGDVEIF